MKKKILIVFIIIMLFLIIVIHSFLNRSFADSIPAGFKLNEVETKVGEEVNIELVLTNEKTFLSTDFVINYDATKLEYVSYVKGNIENFTILANESEKGTIKIAGIQDPAQSRTVQANTSLIILKFNVINGRGTQSSINLQCNSLYTSETQKAQTVQSNGIVEILSTSALAGNIVVHNAENSQAHAYLYKEENNNLIDESIIDNNGLYNLEATEPGEYYIKIKKIGYLDYNIRGIGITEINNTTKTINNIDLVPGDMNDDGEIELLDLINVNDRYIINKDTNNLSKESIIRNYGKKADNVNINDIGYEE